MIKATKLLLLFTLVAQVSLMPVAQVFAAQHHHDDALGDSSAIFTSASTESVEQDNFIKFNNPNMLTSGIVSSLEHQHWYPQNRCGQKNDLQKEDDGCGSCQCMSIITNSASVQETPIFRPTEHFNIRLSHTLYSVVVSPPLRPPTS